jgi:hypothetical protein
MSAFLCELHDGIEMIQKSAAFRALFQTKYCAAGYKFAVGINLKSDHRMRVDVELMK